MMDTALFLPDSFMNIIRSTAAISGMAGLLLLTGCVSVDTTGDSNGSASSSSSSSTAATGTSSVSSSSAGTSSSVAATTDADARIITMTSKNWEFSPTTITAKKGEKVVVRLTNVDGIHSFGAMELGLNVRINPGETVDITIPTDKTGTFEFRCLVPCGPGHKDMKGAIVIS